MESLLRCKAELNKRKAGRPTAFVLSQGRENKMTGVLLALILTILAGLGLVYVVKKKGLSEDVARLEKSYATNKAREPS